jgi:AAA domain
MMLNSQSPFTYQTRFWKAEYHDPPLRTYRGNPLIEALPPIYEPEQVYKLLQHDPGYDESYREWPTHLRLHLFLEAARFFQPLSIHFELEQRFSRLIRAGYVGRNPLDLGFWAETERRLHLMEENTVFRSTPRVSTQGFTLMGISGTGKSRTIESILPLYPQIIQHNEYCGRRFTWTQVVYLKLDCPHDGSISGLCHDYFHQMDQLLGTNYYENHGLRGKPSIEKMRVAMARVASDHSLGVLIIDEIQDLRLAKSDGAHKMLSFLVKLDNTIGVPIVFVGTPNARAVLAGEFRRARRAAGQGDLPWERMKKEKDPEKEKDSEWRMFLESLWKYQYVREKSDLTDELSEAMYDESQGIADIAIKLYFLAQIRAIDRKKERVTVDMIRKAARERLQSVQEPLQALRSGNKTLLRKYEDLQPIDLEGAVWEALRNVGTSSSPEVAQGSSPTSEPASSEEKSARQEKDGTLGSQESQGTQQPSEGEDEQKSKGRTAKVEGGLLEIAAKGRERGMTAYEALKKRGFIRDASEYLVEVAQA